MFHYYSIKNSSFWGTPGGGVGLIYVFRSLKKAPGTWHLALLIPPAPGMRPPNPPRSADISALPTLMPGYIAPGDR